MKTIKIRKSKYFSSNSKIFAKTESNKLFLKGFGLFTISVNPGENLFATQLWTSSNKVSYDEIMDGSTLIVRPRLGRNLVVIITIIFVLGVVVFSLTKFKWSFIFLLPFAIYILLYLTIFKNKYLILKQETN
jgi:hypothetical protein